MTESETLLFTPGPLTCHREVHQSMQRDIGSRDEEFIALVSSIRGRLLEIGSAGSDHTAVLMQGSGTFGLESAVTTLIGKKDRLLVLENGAYGERLSQIAHRSRLQVSTYQVSPAAIHDPQVLKKLLRENQDISHVAMVHCETTTGILNPLEDLARVIKEEGRILLVDAMSSFGGIPISMAEAGIDCLVSSSNKCIEGVPGFSFVITSESLLSNSEGNCPVLTLDLYEQWKGLEENGQFRFTPPTHAILAFNKALELLREEGGIQGRNQRYLENHRVLIEGMTNIGLSPVIAAELQSPIITAFRYPDSADHFNFEAFYEDLSGQGFTIYPGKLAEIDAFRIGTIGQIYPDDVANLISAISTFMKTR